MTGGKETPNIVKEITVGNTRIKIADDYCRGMSAADIKSAIREIARTARENLTAAAARCNG